MKTSLSGSGRHKAVWGSKRILSLVVERLNALVHVTFGLVVSLRAAGTTRNGRDNRPPVECA